MGQKSKKGRRDLSDSSSRIAAISSGASVFLSSIQDEKSLGGYLLDYEGPGDNYYYGWVPHSSTPLAEIYAQIGFQDPVFVHQIKTQGRSQLDPSCSSCSQYVKTFKVSYSLNGVEWTALDPTYEANNDTSAIVTNKIDPPILARAIKIYPRTYNSFPSMRFEIDIQNLNKEDYLKIQDVEQIAAICTGARVTMSSTINYSYRYGYQIDYTYSFTTHRIHQGWRADPASPNPYIQIGSSKPRIWNIIATRPGESSYVNQFTISYTLNGEDWLQYNNNEVIHTYHNESSLRVYSMDPPIAARALRLYIIDFYNYPSTRVEAYYGPNKYNFIHNGENELISASLGCTVSTSSDKDIHHKDTYNLYYEGSSGSSYNGGWCSHSSDTSPWIQISAPEKKTWKKFKLQARGNDYDCQDCNDFVKTFFVKYSNDGTSWIFISSFSSDTWDYGSSSSVSSPVEFELSSSVEAKMLRIYPMTTVSSSSEPYLRFDAYYTEYEEIEIGLPSILNGAGVEMSSYYWEESSPNLFSRFGYKLNEESGIINSWRPHPSDSEPWISIGVSTFKRFVGVATQGEYSNNNNNYWTQKYKVQCSINGADWEYFDSEKTYQGNSDQSTIVVNVFSEPKVCTSLRILPLTWHGSILGMRVEAYYEELPVADIYYEYSYDISGFLGGSQTLVSSFNYSDSKTDLGSRYDYRINSEYGIQKMFSFNEADSDPYFQVATNFPKKFTSILIKGLLITYLVEIPVEDTEEDTEEEPEPQYEEHSYYEFISSFSLSYSLDGQSWNAYDQNPIETGEGSLINITLSNPFLARAIKIVPEVWNGSVPQMQIDIGYQELDISSALSLNKDSEIAAIQSGAFVEVSSFYSLNSDSAGHRIAYSLNDRSGVVNAWRAGTDDTSQWIQISAGAIKLWTSIKTSGRNEPDKFCLSCNEFVMAYKIQYSTDGQSWKSYLNGHAFFTNSDTNTVVTIYLTPKIKASAIRIIPTLWNNHISMQVEAYYKEVCDWKCNGCYLANSDQYCTECLYSSHIISTFFFNYYTCTCEDGYVEDLEAEECVVDYDQKSFDFTLAGANGYKCIEDSSIKFSKFSPLDGTDHGGQLFEASGYLKILSSKLFSFSGGVSILMKFYVIENRDQYLISTDSDEYALNIKLSEDGDIFVEYFEEYYGKKTLETSLSYQNSTWMALFAKLTNVDGKSNVFMATKIAEHDWTTYSYEESEILHFIRVVPVNSEYFILGKNYSGYINTLQFESFGSSGKLTNDIPAAPECMYSSISGGLSNQNDKCTNCTNTYLIDQTDGFNMGYCGKIEITISGSETPDRYIDNTYQIVLNISDITLGKAFCYITGENFEMVFEYNSTEIIIPKRTLIIDNNIQTLSVLAVLSPTYNESGQLNIKVINPIKIIFEESGFDVPVIDGVVLNVSQSYIEGDTENEFELKYQWICSDSEDEPCLAYDEITQLEIYEGAVVEVGGKNLSSGIYPEVTKEYFFQVRAYFEDAELYSEDRFTFTVINTPPVSPYLVYPDGVKLSANKKIRFSMVVDDSSLESIECYNWYLVNETGGGETVDTEQFIIVDEYLTIPSDTIDPGTVYTLIARIECDEGYATGKYQFETSKAVDSSNASFLMEPETGNAISTLFSIDALNYVDGEGYDLEFLFKYRVLDDADDKPEFKITSITNETSVHVDLRLPGQDALMATISLRMYVSNLYEAYVLIEERLVVFKFNLTEFNATNENDYLKTELPDLDEFGKIHLMSVMGSTYLKTEEKIEYDENCTCAIVDKCGDCGDYGMCNNDTKTCECLEGYTLSRMCTYTDDESSLRMSLIKTMLEEIEVILGEEAQITTDLVSLIKIISGNIDLITVEQYQSMLSMTNLFLENDDDLTSEGAKECMTIFSNLQKISKAFYLRNYIGINSEESAKNNAKILSKLAKKQLVDVGVGETIKKDVGVKLLLTKNKPERMKNSVLKANENSTTASEVTLPNCSLSNSTKPLSISYSEYEDSPILQNSSTLSHLVNVSANYSFSADMISAVEIQLEDEDENPVEPGELESPLKVKLSIKDKMPDLTRRNLASVNILCVQYDNDQELFTEDGIELLETTDDEYIVCGVTHMLSQGLYSAVITVVEKIDSILDNVDSLTDLGSLSDYKYYNSYAFWICNGLVLIMTISLVRSYKKARTLKKAQIRAISPSFEIAEKDLSKRSTQLNQLETSTNILTKTRKNDSIQKLRGEDLSDTTITISDIDFEDKRPKQTKSSINVANLADRKDRILHQNKRIIDHLQKENNALRSKIPGNEQINPETIKVAKMEEAEANPKAKASKLSLCLLYITSHFALAPFIGMKTNINQVKTLMIFYLNLFLLFFISGIMFDPSTGNAADDDISINQKIFFSLISIGISLPFITILTKILVFDPPKPYSPKRLFRRAKIRNIVGVGVFIIMIVVCVIWINILSAKFESAMTETWVLTYGMTLFGDFCIVQNVKSLFVVSLMCCLKNKGDEEYSVCEELCSLIVDSLLIG